MSSRGEYLTTAEAAKLLRLSVKTLRNKVTKGMFRQGEHFFRRPGLGPRWSREALVEWVEGKASREIEVIPLAQASGRRVA
jgi:excisionase family DNA binding protein